MMEGEGGAKKSKEASVKGKLPLLSIVSLFVQPRPSRQSKADTAADFDWAIYTCVLN